MIEFLNLLRLEQKYHPNDRPGPISQYIGEFPLSEGTRQKLLIYGITNCEYLAILLFCGNQAPLFQNYLADNRIPNELELELSNLLDSALNKLPPTENERLWRYDTYGDPGGYEENTVISVNYYLTTTERILGEVSGTKVIWQITPLTKNETRARRIYPIHEISILPEYQVDFMKGTKFRIDKIINGDISLMYVTEIGNG